MNPNGNKIVIIGGGIAGLCCAVYGLKCGYQVEVLEMHDVAGGLATSWKRGPYTFETCLHWLLGSKPDGEMHGLWQEVFDIDRLTFVDPEEFVRIENEAGDSLAIYTDVDRLEAELMHRAPQDAGPIHDLTHMIRVLGKFRMIDPSEGVAENWLNMLRDLPLYPSFSRLAKTSCAEYGSHFSDPLIRSFFAGGDMGKMSAVALVFSLAWMNAANAGYAVGGSQAIIRLIEEKIAALGGTITLGAKVDRILVENDTAVGVRLADGRELRANWVISAADGHETIYDLLDGSYSDESVRYRYERMETFPSYLQVSLGVKLDLWGRPPMLTRILEQPFTVDPETKLDAVSFRIFNFDPTFAPAGSTAITCFLPTRNFAYWTSLRENDLETYGAEKRRVADAAIDILAKAIPGVRSGIEVVDVSTPASVLRYTGNWKGSMEGWLILPGMGFRQFPNTLPGLRRMVMAGQWILPGGGLPSGVMTARSALRSICKHDHLLFPAHADLVKSELVGA